MNVLTKLSIENLRLNKKRTISTIVGIILSVALICAVAGMATSFQETLIQNATNEYGYYHLKIQDIEDKDIESLKNNRDIKDIFYINKLGDATVIDSKKETKVNLKEIIFYRIFSTNRENFDRLNLILKEGEFPKNGDEILINETVIRRKKLDIKVGDKITLDIGKIDYDLEKVIANEQKEFKVVGIIERPNTAFESYDAPYTIITTDIETDKKDVYLSLKNPKDYKTSFTELLGGKNYKDVDGHSENLKYNSYEENKELLRWEVFAFSDSTVAMMFSVIAVVMLIIIFTSVFCIRNSFAIATTEKIKMYGMLASVGATKKQIRKNVIFECMLLGIIGIPIGILSGILAVFIVLKIVNTFIGNYLLVYVDGIVFKVTILPIIIATVLGIITIYLSAISSARRASKVSPIESLRGAKEIKLSSKKLKTPKFISKIFKTGGVIAYKNLKRSKRKYRTTVISISVSIFIFISLNAFIVNTFDLTDDYYKEYDYNLEVQFLRETDEKMKNIEKILQLDNIQDSFIVYYSKSNYIAITDETKVNNEDESGLTYQIEYDEEKDEYIEVGDKCARLDIIGLDDISFQKYAKKIGANYDDIKQTGVLCDDYTYDSVEEERNKEIQRYYYKENDILEGRYKGKDIKIKIGERSNIRPYLYTDYYTPTGLIVIDTKYFPDIDLHLRGIAIQSDNASELETTIEKLDSDIFVRNYEELAREQNSMALLVSIFLYGFIAVITLIGITNIFNTITSNMELRQKEFAMLKSIGMTKREFNNMVNLETLFYGTKSWIYGTILGLIGTFAIYKAFEIKIDKDIYIPIMPIIISAIFVFIFVFIIMRYSISKINKQNTIETIRNENI